MPEQTLSSAHASGSSAIVLELAHVSKRYATRTLFQDISATFTRASLTLLCGKNGSGKTTLLKIMAGLSQATSGSVSSPLENPTIAYVAHPTFLYPQLTALENLDFWNRCYGLNLSEDELFCALQEVGLADFAEDFPRSFSRGMCQKLNLLRALLQKPDLLLLDEPATGLDQDAQVWLRNTLKQLRDSGTCIVLVSHDRENDSVLASQSISLTPSSPARPQTKES